MSNPSRSNRPPPRDQFSPSPSAAAAAPSPFASDSDLDLPQSTIQKRAGARSSATQSPYPAVSAAPTLNKGGGRGMADEPLVRPSRKAPTNKARGVYAPVGQDHELTDDAYHDSSPPPTESDFDSEPESRPPPPKSKASRKNGAVAAGADVEKGESDEPQPSTAWSTTKKLVVGGLVLLALLLIVVLIFLVTNGTSSATSSESAPAASHAGQSNATASSHSTESSHTTNGTISSSHAHPVTEASHLESLSSALLSAFLSSQADEMTAVPVTAGVTSAEAEPPTATAVNNVATDQAVATAVSTGTPFTDPTLGEHEDPQTLQAISTFSHSPNPSLPSETTGDKSTRPATSTATGAPGVPGTTKMSTTATWFGASQHLSACHEIFDDSAMAAAVSPLLFGSDGSSPSELCGAKIRVWQPNSKKTITLSIMDVCNTCPKATAIDLTQGAFLKLAPGGKKEPDAALEKGVLSVQWWFEDPAMQAKLPIGFETWDNAE